MVDFFQNQNYEINPVKSQFANMGNSVSKNVPKIVPKTAIKSTIVDESFGRQIMQNIQLKVSPFILPNNQQTTSSYSTGLKKRIELNKQTEGTVSWNELPLIFAEDYGKLLIEKSKMDEIRKKLIFPTDKQKQHPIKN